MIMSSVDLPEPLGPTTPTVSPCAHGKVHAAQDFHGTGAAVKRKVNIS